MMKNITGMDRKILNDRSIRLIMCGITVVLIFLLFSQAIGGSAQAKSNNNGSKDKKDKDTDDADVPTNDTENDQINYKLPLVDDMDNIGNPAQDNGSAEGTSPLEGGMAMDGGMMEGMGFSDADTLAYYSFDNPDDVVNDDSGNGWDLTLGAGDDEPGITGNTLYGRALYFDGSDDIASRDGACFDTTTFLTVEAYVFCKGQDVPNKPGTIADRYKWTDNERIFNFYLATDDKLTFTVWDSLGAPTTVVSTSGISLNEWHYVAGTFNGNTKALKLFIDGVEDNSTTAVRGDLETDADIDLKIGDNTIKGGESNPFFGIIDEVRISEAAREIGDTVGFWNFNEDAGSKVRDRSLQGLSDGSISGASLGTGRYGKALIYDGSNDYVHIPSDSRLHLTAEMTIEAWVKYNGPGTDATGTTDTIMSQVGHFWLHVPRNGDHAGKVVFEGGNAPWTPDIISTSTLEDNTWTHIAVVRSSTTYVEIYINGILDAEGNTYAANGASANSIYIGCWDGSKHHFKGYIDEVSISNQEKTFGGYYGQDALELPFEGSNWDGSEDNGILDDRSPHDNDMDQKLDGTTQSAEGKYGKCISLDGNGDYLKMNSPVPSSLNPPTVTVEAWINPSEKKFAAIVDNSYGANIHVKGGYVLRLRDDGKIEFFVYNDNQNRVSAVSSTVLVTGDWYHVAGTSDGYRVRVFVDGVCEAMTTYEDDISYGQDVGLYVGAGYYGDKQFFNGLIDSVRISSYARTFREDTDGDGMSDLYEIMRSNQSDQYDPAENNGRHALLVAPNPQDLGQEAAFWNDAKFLYDVLKSYGYLDTDIHMLHKTGTDVKTGSYATPAGVTYTDGPATPAELQVACTNLSLVVHSSDFLFISLIDHGTRNIETNHSYLRMNDGQGGHIDLQDDTFAGNSYVGKITDYKYRAFFMQQAYGGGFVNDLSNSKTVTATSCKYNELSYPTSGDGDENAGENGEFDFYFMSAFASHTPTNYVHIDPDDPVGVTSMVSLYETYKWVKDHENRPEHPQIDDDGDSRSPQDGDNDDGYDLAYSLYL